MIPRRCLVVTGTFLLSVLLYVDRVCISTAEGPITQELAYIIAHRQAGADTAPAGKLMSVREAEVGPAIFWLSLAVFGVDMVLSPSWSFCIDIGGKHAGQVSGTMNMAGNIGSAIIGPLFPTLLLWTGSANVFFYIVAACSVVAAGCWMLADSTKKISDLPA